MTPERLKPFFTKPPNAGRYVQLVAELGLGSTIVVQTWTRDQCEASADPALQPQVDLGEECVACAQEHVDNSGEAAHFIVQWMNVRDLPLKTVRHTASPKDNASRATAAAGGGVETMSANRIISELLSALKTKDAAIDKVMGTVLGAAERVLQVQNKAIDTLTKKLDDAPQATGLARTDAEIAAELETQGLKQKAYLKLIDKAPDIAELAIAAIAQAIQEKVSGSRNNADNQRPRPTVVEARSK